MAESGFARKTLPQLIARTRNDVLSRIAADDVLRRLDGEVYARVVAAVEHGLYGYIEYLARNILPDLCDADWLLRHASMKGVPRKVAEAASGNARFDGVADGVVVGAGVLFQGPDAQEFLTTAVAVAAGGVLLAPVICQKTGVSGNLDDGTDLQLVTPISGLSSVAQADTIVGGLNEEELEDWRARVLAKWREEPQGGNLDDYRRWALEVPGVARAWPFRALAGTGIVTVVVATADLVDPTPSAGLLADVFTYIDTRRPAGSAGLVVSAPVLVPLNPTIMLAPDTPSLRELVTQGLREFLYREGVLGGMTLELSRISEAISLVDGEFSHVLMAPTVAPTYATLELPVLGSPTWAT